MNAPRLDRSEAAFEELAPVIQLPGANGNAPASVSWLEDAAALLAEPDPGPTPFLVDSLIVDQAIAMIAGPAKTRKTWTLLELAVAVQTGRPAFGEFAVAESGPVIVVLEESGRAAFHRRLSALARGNGIDVLTLAGFHFAANRGVRLDDAEWQERLVSAAVAIQPRAIFLDPLVRMKGASRDENDEKEMGPVLNFLRDLRNESGSAVVFVHHTGHSGTHARGTSDFEAYWESRLGISHAKSPAATSVKPEHRESETPDPFKWRSWWDGTTRSVRLTVDAEDAEAIRRKQVRAYLAAHPEAPANEVWREVGGRKQDVLNIVRDLRDEP
jgi:AAA domain